MSEVKENVEERNRKISEELQDAHEKIKVINV